MEDQEITLEEFQAYQKVWAVGGPVDVGMISVMAKLPRDKVIFILVHHDVLVRRYPAVQTLVRLAS